MNDKKNLVIIALVIIIILLCTLLFMTYNEKVHTKDNVNNNSSDVATEKKLSMEDAINVGTTLYDKATEIYEVWVLRPYCGYSNKDIYNNKMVDFGISSLMYYETDYDNLDGLKDYLKEYLSSDIVEEKVGDGYITDTSTIRTDDDSMYTNYIVQNGKLYCRAHTGKGFFSSYVNSYDITVDSIEEDTITYNIKSAYGKDNTKCSESNNISDCSEEDLEYKDTKFVIKKVNDNFVVSDYTLHE